jgi:hypothetical protein
MPHPRANVLHVSPFQHELLERMVHRSTNAQRLVKRGHIILEAAEGISHSKIAQHLQVGDETVRRWRDRWHTAQARLEVVEATARRALCSPIASGTG